MKEEKRTYQEQTRAPEERFTAPLSGDYQKRVEELSHNNHQQLHSLLSPSKSRLRKWKPPSKLAEKAVPSRVAN